MKRLLCPVIAAFAFLFYFFLFEGIGHDYWDIYIAAPATFIVGKPAIFVDERGQIAYRYNLKGSLPDDLVDKNSYGIVSKDQRIGAGVTFSIAYLAFGVIGFRFLYAAFGAMAFLFSYLVGRRLFKGEILPIILGLLVSVNPFMLSMNRLNANFISVPIFMALFAMLLEDEPKFLLAGLVYGALGGIRNEAIVMIPVLLILIMSKKEGVKGLIAFALGALITITPYLFWNKYAFGKPLIHASQYAEFDGYRPVFTHKFLWWTFDFNGLLNFPFYDRLVRTPHFPFPTYLTLPLVIVLCFGIVLCACAIVGLYAQWRKSKSIFWALVLWFSFMLGLFLFQENWEEPKTTFVVLSFCPLCVLIVTGIEFLFAEPILYNRLFALTCIALFIRLGVYCAGFVRVPADERWYVRFPKAKIEFSKIGCLDDQRRREWFIFHTDECPSELDFQRRKLTQGHLLPRLYYPLSLKMPNLAEEWNKYEPKLFDIWNKIYGL